MQFNVIFVATALLSSASLAMSATITAFAGAGCTGPMAKVSMCRLDYSGVPGQIQFFISGGGHNSCTNGPSLVLGGGSGCATTPDGVNWESVAVF
ncbi:hypothetical protein B0H13DRAFT_2319717 [Mycena leptocephala]|nr:hypothetical protein B0H13DRAFT_2319717 [Mycena leptocephala]